MSKKLYDKILGALFKDVEPDIEKIESLGYVNFNSIASSSISMGGADVNRVRLCEDTVHTPNQTDFTADVLIIGGGGGGGRDLYSPGGGCGAGAGGYREFTKKYYTGTSYTVTVGAGGAGGNGYEGQGSDGSNSSIEKIAHGGGGGGNTTWGGIAGRSGGSGGGSGGSAGSSITPRCNGSSQGNSGGLEYGGPGGAAAGGGGAGASGTTNGGDGITSTITGSSVTRAGGGGGSGFSYSTPTTGASGGSGGGGDGGDASWTLGAASANGGNGTVNTGGGGGGGGSTKDGSGGSYVPSNSGNGGSGFVCIKFPDTITITIGGGLTYTSSTSGGYTTVQFTAGTDTISFHNDQYWNNTVLILQDSFTDESPQALTLTVGTGVRLSSTSKVGSQSIEAFGNGTATRMSLPTDSSLDIGTSNDFTFEFWMKNNSQDSYAVLLSSVGTGTTGSISCSSFTGNKLRFNYAPGSYLASTTNLVDNAWHHVAITRASGNLRLFIDGVEEDSDATNSANITWSGNAFFDWLGNTLSDNEYRGFIDAIRITSGVARYTSTFTPSTQRYT